VVSAICSAFGTGSSLLSGFHRLEVLLVELAQADVLEDATDAVKLLGGLELEERREAR
jgi:hypothetical protein